MSHVDEHAPSRYIVGIDLGTTNSAVAYVDGTDERPVVSKTARVVEEIAVGREGSDRTEIVRDTVRRQQAEVEKVDPIPKKKSA